MPAMGVPLPRPVPHALLVEQSLGESTHAKGCKVTFCRAKLLPPSTRSLLGHDYRLINYSVETLALVAVEIEVDDGFGSLIFFTKDAQLIAPHGSSVTGYVEARAGTPNRDTWTFCDAAPTTAADGDPPGAYKPFSSPGFSSLGVQQPGLWSLRKDDPHDDSDFSVSLFCGILQVLKCNPPLGTLIADSLCNMGAASCTVNELHAAGPLVCDSCYVSTPSKASATWSSTTCTSGGTFGGITKCTKEDTGTRSGVTADLSRGGHPPAMAEGQRMLCTPVESSAGMSVQRTALRPAHVAA